MDHLEAGIEFSVTVLPESSVFFEQRKGLEALQLAVQPSLYHSGESSNRYPIKGRFYDVQAAACVEKTTYRYDQSPVAASDAVQHAVPEGVFGPTDTVRGNLTAVGRWSNTDNSVLWKSKTYDNAGNILTSTDPNGNSTSYIFNDSWQTSACAPTSGNGAAYATTTINAKLQTHNCCLQFLCWLDGE